MKLHYTDRKAWLADISKYYPGSIHYLMVRPTGTYIHIGHKVVGQYCTKKGLGWMFIPASYKEAV